MMRGRGGRDGGGAVGGPQISNFPPDITAQIRSFEINVLFSFMLSSWHWRFTAGRADTGREQVRHATSYIFTKTFGLEMSCVALRRVNPAGSQQTASLNEGAVWVKTVEGKGGCRGSPICCRIRETWLAGNTEFLVVQWQYYILVTQSWVLWQHVTRLCPSFLILRLLHCAFCLWFPFVFIRPSFPHVLTFCSLVWFHFSSVKVYFAILVLRVCKGFSPELWRQTL